MVTREKQAVNRDHLSEEAGIIVVRPQAVSATKQHLPNFVGISAATAGATGLCMNIVTIPPGGKAEPHLHRGYETAIYVLKGRIKTLFGAALRQSVITEAGDFLFIPANLPHQPVNLSQSEAAQAIVARNVADEQESVELYDPREA